MTVPFLLILIVVLVNHFLFCDPLVLPKMLNALNPNFPNLLTKHGLRESAIKLAEGTRVSTCSGSYSNNPNKVEFE